MTIPASLKVATLALLMLASPAGAATLDTTPKADSDRPSRVDTGRERVQELERRLSGPDGSVMIVAHRGCWKETSENSLDAIEACVAAGIDMVELDVRATRDGVLVLMHDKRVDRTTNGSGAVADLDWDYLRTLRLREGNGRDTALTARGIPTFEEALRTARDRILINIDAKTSLTDELLAEVDRTGRRSQVLFKNAAPADKVRRRAPWIDSVAFQPIIRRYLQGHGPKAAIASYDGLRPIGYEIDLTSATAIAALRPTIQQRCRRFWVNSLNRGRSTRDTLALTDPDRAWGRLIADGVDTIQTDEPLALKAYVDERGLSTFQCGPEEES